MTILDTQSRLNKAQAEYRVAEEFLNQIKQKLADAVQAHREQIARSLRAKDEKERVMAEMVREWWEVPKPSISSSS